MKPRRFQAIRNPEAFERSQRAKAKKHQARIEKIAVRLVAIVRDKHDGDLEVRGLPQAWILLTEGGALKPNDGRYGDVSRQLLVEQALKYAIDNSFITLTADSESSQMFLTVPCVIPTTSSEAARLMAIERYEEELPRISGRHFAHLRHWGEAV